jgi:hypothetical protein
MLELKFKTVNFFATNDYSQFNFFEFNRPIDKNHVNKLAKSMKKRGFTGALIVIRTATVDGIEKLYILDGQHRFMASKQLGIDFKFEIVDIKTELDLAHYIADVNNSSKAWGTNQFLDVWSQMKITEYVKLQEVYKETKIQITPLVMVYTGIASMNDFRGGTMTFPDVDKSNQIIEQIMDLKGLLPTKAFCRRAIIRVMRKETYNHEVIKPYIERKVRQGGGFTENEKDLEKELEHLLKISNKY